MTPDANDLCVFAVKRGDIESRIDTNYSRPQYIELVHSLRKRFGDILKPLGTIADVICGPFGSAIKNTDYRESGIPLVRITNITKEGYMSYDDLVYISDELGNSLARTQVVAGDIVISQRGSLGQCAIVDNTFEKLNISANIIAIKNIRESSVSFIHDYLLSTVGQALLDRSISGQVQQKITTQDIAGILIPVGCDETYLSGILMEGYKSFNNKRKQANELLRDFDNKLSNKYTLLTKDNKKLCFAVLYKEIDGVLDAKRYSTIKHEASHSSNISNVCVIVDNKVNVLQYGEQLVDWIRIDDLPNQPLGIEVIRTQPANEIEGPFFEVQEDDILVARLGPTILNQKIVMVHSLKRTTIASAEFLVLRCKPGYEPEAVMAILKTAYYRDLMYSKARGSTPSRYRLNREDALKLPFPDIRESQDTLAAEALRVRDEVLKLRREAVEEWERAKEQFEKALLGK